jgi:hypothetical protein
MLAQILLLLESLVALFALERLFKFFKEPSPSFFWCVYDWILIISIDHDNGTLPFLFIYFK